ncbi:voltage-gated potassium channel [Escherichia coli]|uniref:Voltage-gated potassium channel n=1 Tax=Escherichia coli TaxID=562 RepID=A0A376P6A2_ECOLX|nr:voltage-gated potassium channel [Escherichia coli]
MLANAPLFMLGVFLVLNSIGLLFRAKLAWAISIILLLIALIYTLHFYPWLKFSIGFCIFTLVFLLILRKDFSHSSAAAGQFLHLLVSRHYCFTQPTVRFI